MSSPKPLSPKKNSELNSRTPSPLKSGQLKRDSPFQSPVKLAKLGVSLRPKASTSLFKIYEDTADEHAKHHTSVDNPELIHDDKENILQPKKAQEPRSKENRVPLGNLSRAEFPGFVVSQNQLGRLPRRLTHLYQPSTYQNEQLSTHKFNGLPSFITPPRNSMKKILHRSNENEEDEVERLLVKKEHGIYKRKRSMSVGVNKGKHHLITKTRFTISA